MRPALFSAKNIVKNFPGAPEPALNGASLDIIEGECLVISGANGSGKTLLMKIISGLAPPDKGEALFMGRPMLDAKGRIFPAVEKQIRRELGIVFQDADAQIVGQTVAEDAAFGPECLGYGESEAAERARAALAALGMEKMGERDPRRLSGGEKRRLAVAGAVASGCRALILDEPFANLDWPGVKSVIEMIGALKSEGKTLAILTHELEKIIHIADRLAILYKGRVCSEGAPRDVLDALRPEWGVRDPRRPWDFAAGELCAQG
ncbi:MAG: energy-coupling factor ABC transporter ATP-binding protein [Treponema sp.]|nr:energy-coupling factor ABC transporter ATP-binding protein [Treponema sp.]